MGRLGTFHFPAGWYVYVGSAMGGLEQRVARHRHPSPIRRWHLDYLRAEAPVREVHLFPSPARRECDLARAVLALPFASVPVPRFGASDCRCPAHLAHFPGEPPRRDELIALLREDEARSPWG
ncbi:MAG: GIY-YIG nuclease family protein [Chloroflexi bacterium]|nr:GIY-YIG nuclease family protein [Chloroflexota bacterium]